MRVFRLIFRCLLLLFGSLFFTFYALFFRMCGASFSTVHTGFTYWKKLMIWGLNVKIEAEGPIPTLPGVIMANHRSYVDVLSLSSKTPLVFVAKKSVSKWPVIGWGGTALHTVWVERSSKESRTETRKQLKKRLEEGISVAVFPEGTTTRGPETLAFKPGMFHTVAEGNLPVYALAIEYQNPKIAWVDDDLFLPHFFQIFSQKSIRLKIKFSEPMKNPDGEKLRLQCYHWINAEVKKFRNQWDAETRKNS